MPQFLSLFYQKYWVLEHSIGFHSHVGRMVFFLILTYFIYWDRVHCTCAQNFYIFTMDISIQFSILFLHWEPKTQVAALFLQINSFPTLVTKKFSHAYEEIKIQSFESQSEDGVGIERVYIDRRERGCQSRMAWFRSTEVVTYRTDESGILLMYR